MDLSQAIRCRSPIPNDERDSPIPSSSNTLIYIRVSCPNTAGMLVKGELDALCVTQEASDLLAVVAIGSTMGVRLERWVGRQVRRGETVYEMDTSRVGAPEPATTPIKGTPANDLETHADPAPVEDIGFGRGPRNAQPPTLEGDLDGAHQATLRDTMEPEPDDNQADVGDVEEAAYTSSTDAWQMLARGYAFWKRNVHTGDGARDRQFANKLAKRAGAEIIHHIEVLQEMADSLQAFEAALQCAFEP
jgi:hypothetical protein